MLKLQNINAGYGPKQILRNISLAIESSEVVALLGSNGAGKSTVLKVVSGLLKPMSGSVLLRDENITSLPTYRRARLGIGYVMQNGPLFGSLTAAEHKKLATQSRGRKPPEYGIGKPPERTNDMDSRKTGGVLSGGERQRLAVELCLQQNPKLLLLDEPSAGVSPGRAAEIYALLKERIKKTQTAVLWWWSRICIFCRASRTGLWYCEAAKFSRRICRRKFWRTTKKCSKFSVEADEPRYEPVVQRSETTGWTHGVLIFEIEFVKI